MQNSILRFAAISGFICVILGALGAHALKQQIAADALDSFATGVRYQAWHSIALLALLNLSISKSYLKAIFIFWALGMCLFSGSIYLLSTQTIWAINWSFLGPITPIGGLLLIAGWFTLFLSTLRKKSST